jgi:hypothetical protein
MECVCDNYERKEINRKIKMGIVENIKGYPTDDRIIKSIQDFSKTIEELKGIKLQKYNFDSFNLDEIRNSYTTIATATPNKVNDKKYQDSLKIRNNLIEHFKEIFYNVDVIVLPLNPVLPYKHNPMNKEVPIQLDNEMKELKYWKQQSYTTFLSLLGFPVVTFPIGMVGKFPLGVQVVADFYNENILFSVCKFLEIHFDKYLTQPPLSKL